MLPDSTVDPASAASRSLVIVVADDSADVRQYLRRWLQEVGHEVICASSGNEAMHVIRQVTVDLVITEVILPNGDGLELISALKKVQPTARVLAYSGGGRYLTGMDCLRVAKGLGANEILLKPAARDDLLRAVARAMEGPLPSGATQPGANTVALTR